MRTIIVLLFMYLCINVYTTAFKVNNASGNQAKTEIKESTFPTIWNKGISRRGKANYVRIVIDREAYLAVYQNGELISFDRDQPTACSDGTCSIK